MLGALKPAGLLPQGFAAEVTASAWQGLPEDAVAEGMRKACLIVNDSAGRAS